MSSSEPRERVDVAILGGGMAGLSLARLLQREAPQVSLVTLDTAEGQRRKVGESSVEIGAHFLNARLGLAEVLARTQLPKNGLRFWFDSPEKDLSFQEASEDGPSTFAYWRTYQLERDTLEETLLELDRGAGGEHVYGVRKLEATPGAGGAAHRVTWEQDGRRRELEARWLVDATGIRSLLGRAQGNLVREERLTHSACWAWFRGARRLDDLIEKDRGPARYNWGPRALSTNHLLHEGYWIWVIPLASGLLSVGVGYDHTVVKDPPANLDELCAFLRRHRTARDLLEGAEAVEFGVLKNFSFRPKRSLSGDRIAYVGTAAGFVDPFFSNGVDMIALGCEMTADLIRRDVSGEGLDPARLEAYEGTLTRVFEHYLVSVSKLYPTYVSQELSLIRYRRDVHVYWAIYTWPYFAGSLFDLELLPKFHALSELATERGRFFSALLRHAHGRLKERGELHRGNRGRFTFNQLGFRNTPYVRFEQQLGNPPDFDRLRVALREIDTGCFLAVLDVVFEADRSPLKRLLFEAVYGVHDGLVALWRERGDFDAGFWEEAFARIAAAIEERVAAEGLTLPRLPLDGSSYRRILGDLVDACATPEDALRVRKLFNGAPPLQDFSDLPSVRHQVQPPATWSADHTPWLDGPPEFTSVYDLLGETWWNDPRAPYSALVRWGVRPLLAPKGAGAP